VADQEIYSQGIHVAIDIKDAILINSEYDRQSRTQLSRREFLADTMWGAILALASMSSLAAMAAPSKALAEEASASIVPKELLFNPNWWKSLNALLMGIVEVPILNDAVKTNGGRGDAYTFAKIRMLGEKLNWGTRIVPIGKAIRPDITIIPIQDFEELLCRAKVRGIGQCWCRTTFKNCNRPTDTCIYLSFGEYLPDLLERDGHIAKVSRQEIREVIQRAEDAGLVHELIRAGDDESFYVICNCCPCCCAGLRGLIEFGNNMVVKSDFLSEVNDNCIGCGTCLKRCHFSARTVEGGRCIVETEKCFGCGLCATGCPNRGTFLIKKSV
jgi:ferredoxin